MQAKVAHTAGAYPSFCSTKQVQYSPKIMYTQEVAEEVLVPQEHASGEKKSNCSLSARRSKCKKFKILHARSRKKLEM